MQLPAEQAQTNTSHSLFNLTSWSDIIFGYKIKNGLRTIDAENHEKVNNSQPQLRIYWF